LIDCFKVEIDEEIEKDIYEAGYLKVLIVLPHYCHYTPPPRTLLTDQVGDTFSRRGVCGRASSDMLDTKQGQIQLIGSRSTCGLYLFYYFILLNILKMKTQLRIVNSVHK
jgi:hypothetical protein